MPSPSAGDAGNVRTRCWLRRLGPKGRATSFYGHSGWITDSPSSTFRIESLRSSALMVFEQVAVGTGLECSRGSLLVLAHLSASGSSHSSHLLKPACVDAAHPRQVWLSSRSGRAGHAGRSGASPASAAPRANTAKPVVPASAGHEPSGTACGRPQPSGEQVSSKNFKVFFGGCVRRVRSRSVRRVQWHGRSTRQGDRVRRRVRGHGRAGARRRVDVHRATDLRAAPFAQ